MRTVFFAMIPIWRPITAGTLAALVALPVDRAVPLGPMGSLSRWPLLILTTLVGCYVVCAVPALALVAAICLVVVARAERGGMRLVPGSRAVPFPTVLAVGAAFVAAILAARPATPCFWDAFVWLAKARYAAAGLEQLIAGGLHTKAPPFIPSGYPLFEPLLVAVLDGFSSQPEAVVAGAVGLELLTAGLFLLTVAEGSAVTPRASRVRLVTVAFVLLSSPLVLVHLRSSYVDLPLGLLVGTLAVLLPRSGTGLACTVVAMAAAAMKDEGLLHVAVLSIVGIGWAGLGGHARARQTALRSFASGAAAAAVTGAWRLRLFLAGISNSDHALSLPEWHRVGPLATLVREHVTDVRSWGALWVLGLGAALAVFVRPRSAPRQALWFASALVADGATMFVALLATPGRVMEFATGGSLLNRLGMQLAPLVALLVAAWTSNRRSA